MYVVTLYVVTLVYLPPHPVVVPKDKSVLITLQFVVQQYDTVAEAVLLPPSNAQDP